MIIKLEEKKSLSSLLSCLRSLSHLFLSLSHHQTGSKGIQTKETQKPRPIKLEISDQIRDLFQLSTDQTKETQKSDQRHKASRRVHTNWVAVGWGHVVQRAGVTVDKEFSGLGRHGLILIARGCWKLKKFEVVGCKRIIGTGVRKLLGGEEMGCCIRKKEEENMWERESIN
jgi:hypothetical protein